MESWLDESETLAEICWEKDNDLNVDQLHTDLHDVGDVSASGTSLGSTPRSTTPQTILNEFAAADSSRDVFAYECASLTLRKLADEDAKDLDVIGQHLGLSLDEESNLLSTPQGRREWIRKEMIRREHEFVKFRPLTIRACTWNVHGRRPMAEFSEWLLPRSCSIRNAPDLILISFQEVQALSGVSAVTTDAAKGMAWKDATERTLDSPSAYMTIAARQMVGILLIVMVKRCHEPFIRDLMLADAGTGFMGSGGNKGAVSCRFAFYDKTISVVSCHLAAHEQNVDKRNKDFHEVLRKTAFSPDPLAKQENSPFSYLEYGNEKAPTVDGTNRVNTGLSLNLLEHDVCFWIGDLNYRIQLPVDRVMKLIEDKNWKELYRYDQLENVRISGEAFQGFEEGELDFAPTYQYARDNNEYAKKENENQVSRTPSWTDRVLWRDRIRTAPRTVPSDRQHANEQTGRGIKLNLYRRHEIFSSDHRPVSAEFSLECRIINIKARNLVVQKIHRQLARRENALRPRLIVSSMSVHVGDVKFGQVVTTEAFPIVLRNDGRVTTKLRILVDEFPPWLALDDSASRANYELAPKQTCQLVFRVLVTSGTGCSTALNMGVANLIASPRVLIQNNSELVLSLTGNYLPTSLGNRLEDLSGMIEPIVGSRNSRPALFKDPSLKCPPTDNELFLESEKRDDLAATRQPIYDRRHTGLAPAHSVLCDLDSRFRPPRQRPKTFPVPKEIWLLVEFLFGYITATREKLDPNRPQTDRQEVQVSSIFPQGSAIDTTQVLYHIDRDLPIHPDTPVAAVGKCLMNVLSCLEEAVVPPLYHRACLRLADHGYGKCTVDDLDLTFQGMPTTNLNTFKYLCAFLNEVIVANRENAACSAAKQQNDEDTSAPPSRTMEVAQLFGPLLLGLREWETDCGQCAMKKGNDAPRRLEDRAALFLCHVMSVGKDFYLTTEFNV